MILELVAELLSGETLVTAGGPVDSLTAAAADVELWGMTASAETANELELVGAAGEARPA